MTTNHVVLDEQLGAFARRQNDLFRRVRDGSLPFELVMRSLQQIIEGNFDAVPQTWLNRIIDCDAQPWIPYEDWKVEEHQKGGEIEFDPNKVELYLEESQKTGTILGHDLRQKLQGKRVMNACVLDFLLANTNLIPEAWKQDSEGRTRYIYFWGTVYRDSDGSLYVRCLCWDDGQWRWSFDYLVDEWDPQGPAAISAS